MSSNTNPKYRRNYDEMISWMKEVLNRPESDLSQKIRMDLLMSVFKTGVLFFFLVICTIVIFHCYIYSSLILDLILILLGTLFSIYKGLFLGCLGVYDKYNPKKKATTKNRL
jgi:ABC-type proline/glycine betaine transport system permease subunit